MVIKVFRNSTDGGFGKSPVGWEAKSISKIRVWISKRGQAWCRIGGSVLDSAVGTWDLAVTVARSALMSESLIC